VELLRTVSADMVAVSELHYGMERYQIHNVTEERHDVVHSASYLILISDKLTVSLCSSLSACITAVPYTSFITCRVNF